MSEADTIQADNNFSKRFKSVAAPEDSKPLLQSPINKKINFKYTNSFKKTEAVGVNESYSEDSPNLNHPRAHSQVAPGINSDV